MRWNSELLSEAIEELRTRRGDRADIEVKSAAGGLPALAPTICAFANMPEGGTIILGLDEANNFAPVGLENLATLEQGLAAQGRTAVTPPVRMEFQTFQVSGRAVLVAEVEALPLQNRPARHGGLAYLRQSDGDYIMSAQEIAQIELLKTQGLHPTRPDGQAVPETSAADLDSSLLATYLGVARATARRYAAATDEQILYYTGVTTRGGQLTLAGAYALGTLPQAGAPHLGITAAVPLPGGGADRADDLAHFVGPVPDLLEQAMAWVRRNTRTTLTYDPRGHGSDRTELPMRAVREIVANAIVHRNLDAITSSKRVEIRLYDDRLVITSPGGLWGVSESQLGHPGAKSAVNPVLYEVCKYTRMADGSRVIEGEGGGIREALEALRSAGMRPPTFRDSGVTFTAIIWRHTLLASADLEWLADIADGVQLTSEQRAILASMRHGEAWTNARVRAEFAPTDSTHARRMLQQLVDLGLATAQGARGSTTYTLANEADVAASQLTVAEMPVEAAPAQTGTSTAGTKHGDAVLAALKETGSLAELVDRTGLKRNQVQYALRKLIDGGLVEMRGAQGHRSTVYARRVAGGA